MARVLVVDDEEGIRDFVADALEDDGHVTVQAKDGAEAAERLRAQAFDLMITDLRMPGLDGMVIGRDLGRPGLRLGAETRRAIQDADWPGNVRELANALERAAILADDPELRVRDLGTLAHTRRAAGGSSLDDVERDAMARTLAEVGGNRRQAAERLGIGLRTLYEKLKRYGLS